MTPAKRLMDISLALVLAALLAAPLALALCLVWVSDGRPLFYRAERMRDGGKAFHLWKLRTMTVAPAGQAICGGDLSARITPVGRILRRSRLDEVPQLWNVILGDMSLVGPRPPLRSYVDRCPELYGDVLRCRPGLTGLASLAFHRHEERLLRDCNTAEETDQVYVRRCIPRKARIDLIYQRRRTLLLDLRLLIATASLPWYRPAGRT